MELVVNGERDKDRKIKSFIKMRRWSEKWGGIKVFLLITSVRRVYFSYFE